MLTRLLYSLEDITKNIDMEYLPKRRGSTLENKRAHFMIKYIKLLWERRMMRSLEKFVGGIHNEDGNPAEPTSYKLMVDPHPGYNDGGRGNDSADSQILLPHAHTLMTNTKRHLKAQVHVSKNFRYSDTYVFLSSDEVLKSKSSKKFCPLDTESIHSRIDERVKVKEFQERCNIKAFQINKSRMTESLPLPPIDVTPADLKDINDHQALKHIYSKQSMEAIQ
ncbi:hypothetical protein Tco_0347769 [Tanacetum coccineum]